MAQTRSPVLPHDIVRIIIDQLGNSHADLASCSLVCRDWVIPSRSHLFRSLIIYSTHADGDFSTFANFMASAGGQDVCKYIRHLKLRGGPFWLTAEARPRASLRFLLDVVDCLPSLQELEFLWVRHPKETVDLASSMRPRRAIKKLSFRTEHDQPDDVVDILNILGLFSDISQLAFRGGPPDDYVPLDGTPRRLCWPGLVKIESLVICQIPTLWTPLVLHAIKQSGSLDGTLHTLTVGLQGFPKEVEALLPFFHAVAPCIQRFCLNAISADLATTFGFDAHEQLSVIPLEKYINLRSIILVIDDHDEPADVVEDMIGVLFHGYTHLLIRCEIIGRLEHIVFDVRCADNHTIFRLPWWNMDDLFDDIKSLRSVRVDYNEQADFPVDDFLELIPHTRDRGILTLKPASADADWLETPFD